MPDHRFRHYGFKVEIGTSRAIDDDPRQRLIQWRIGVTIARDTATFAERLMDTLAQGDSHVFDRMMRIHCRIANA